MKHRIDRDALNNASPRLVAYSSMTILTGMQDFTPEQQVLGAAAVFLELCDHLGIPPQEAFTVTKNLINGDDGRRVEFKAIPAYLKGEIN